MTTRADAARRAFDAYVRQPCGDVVAARACARAMLDGVDALPDPRRRDALLLLTAAALHVQGRVDREPTLHDVADLIDDPAFADILSRSPHAFHHYVAAELKEWGPLVFAPAARLALATIGAGGRAGSEGADHRHGH